MTAAARQPGRSETAPLRLSEASFLRVAAMLARRCGLRFESDNRLLLERGLARVALAQRLDANRLVELLDDSTPEALLQLLVREVTIGETYFFRHPEHFDALGDTIVPDLLRGDKRTLRAWSAGCAGGEEAYSLAITLRTAAPADCTVAVLGTDINSGALERGRLGRYGRWSQRENIARAGAHVVQHADGTLEVTPELKALVRFGYLNLHDECYPSLLTNTQGLDVIFLRNVLVYFVPEAARFVLRRLTDCLVDGGYLVTTAMEQTYAHRHLEPVRLAGGVVALRKRRGNRVSPATGAAPARAAPLRQESPAKVDTAAPPPSAPAPGAILTAAKHAANRGDLALAADLAGRAVAQARTADALYLRAMVLDEQGAHAECEELLREVIAAEPEHVLSHLRLGMSKSCDAATATRHLRTALRLVEGRPSGEMLSGPEPLPAAWVRKMALAVLGRRAETACSTENSVGVGSQEKA